VPGGIASAEQLAMMGRVLETFSQAYNVSNADERENLAALILELFNMGVRTEEELLTELKNRRG